MPSLRATDHAGEAVWLGAVPEDGKTIRAAPVDALDLGFEGIIGDRHAGSTRPSCTRVRHLHPKGTEIRNVRQLSILSEEELSAIADAMGLAALDPGWLGATLVLRGIADFTHVPPSSRLQSPSGLTLVIDMENLPCTLPAREIEEDAPGHGRAFKAAARDRRGVTAWVERPGRLALGDRLRLFVPDQRGWAP